MRVISLDTSWKVLYKPYMHYVYQHPIVNLMHKCFLMETGWDDFWEYTFAKAMFDQGAIALNLVCKEISLKVIYSYVPYHPIIHE